MSNLIQHAFHGQAVRTEIDQHGEPWFVLGDLLHILGVSRRPSAVAERLDADGVRQTYITDTLGREQQTIVVNEGAMWETIIRSDSPNATPVRRWVTTEVLPSIRRTGSYGSPSFDLTSMDDVALLLTAATNALTRVRELEPPAAAWTALAEANGDYSLRDAAQILDRDPAIKTGQNRLGQFLRQVGWIDHRGIPYQRHVDLGRINSKPQTRVSHRTGERVACEPQLRITIKGLGALHSLLHGAEPLALDRPALVAVS